MTVHFESSSLFLEKGSDVASLRVTVDLYMCAISSGVCTKKTVVILLNLDRSALEEKENIILKNEFMIAHC